MLAGEPRVPVDRPWRVIAVTLIAVASIAVWSRSRGERHHGFVAALSPTNHVLPGAGS